MSNAFEDWKKTAHCFEGMRLEADTTPEEVGEYLAGRKSKLCYLCPANYHCEKSDDREVRCVNAFICLSKESKINPVSIQINGCVNKVRKLGEVTTDKNGQPCLNFIRVCDSYGPKGYISGAYTVLVEGQTKGIKPDTVEKLNQVREQIREKLIEKNGLQTL